MSQFSTSRRHEIVLCCSVPFYGTRRAVNLYNSVCMKALSLHVSSNVGQNRINFAISSQNLKFQVAVDDLQGLVYGFHQKRKVWFDIPLSIASLMMPKVKVVDSGKRNYGVGNTVFSARNISVSQRGLDLYRALQVCSETGSVVILTLYLQLLYENTLTLEDFLQTSHPKSVSGSIEKICQRVV